MRAFLKRLRRKLQRQYLGSLAEQVPERFWSSFTCVAGAAEHVWVLDRLLESAGPKRRVLVVGVHGGRDFWALRARGHDVVGFDLEEVPDCHPTVAGDAECAWPFEDGSFDVVILGEILEHLARDSDALAEARRVVADDGRLVVTVPFGDTHDIYHVRVHNEDSIRRLLALSGFGVADYVERPGLVGGKLWNAIGDALALLVYALTRRVIYGTLVAFHGRAAWYLGRERWIPRRFLSALGLANHGCTILAVKSASLLDYKAVNRREFHGVAQRSASA